MRFIASLQLALLTAGLSLAASAQPVPVTDCYLPAWRLLFQNDAESHPAGGIATTSSMPYGEGAPNVRTG